MDKKEMLKSMMSLKSKLMATVSMLLVSAILLTNVSYAWFVLSTAPEVSGVSTTSGANGALEIALQSTTTTGTLDHAPITSGIGNSSALSTVPVTEANKYWGNIVDISKEYGIDDITLYPARLNFDTASNTVLTSNYLLVPQYGTDGRISDLRKTDKKHYANGGFETGTNYGVNVHGFENDVGEKQTITSNFSRETVRQEAVNNVDALRKSLRKQMIKLIEDNGIGLVSIMLKAVGFTEDWTDIEINAVSDLIYTSGDITNEAVRALRWALLAYVVADTERYTPGDDIELIELGKVYGSFLTMPLSSTDDSVTTIMSVAKGNDPSKVAYPEIVNAVEALVSVQQAINRAKAYIDRTSELFDPGKAGLQIVNPSTAYLKLQNDVIDSAVTGVEKSMEQHYIDEETGLMVVDNELFFIMVGSIVESGLFPDMAVVLGDYSAELLAYMSIDETDNIILTSSVTETTYGVVNYHMRGSNADTVSGYSEDPVTGNLGVLYSAYEAANAREAEGNIPVTTERSNVTAYGYSVDLAFRASESGGLMLQQEATSRVSNSYDDPNNLNENLQGGGSTMTFLIFGDMTGEQAAELVRNIYVVFMDTDTGSIYAVGIADEIETNLEDVTATITLYSVDYDAMEEAGDGIIRLGNPVTNNVITQMTADEEYYITAVVYLNGDTVSSSDVSPRGLSLIGSINLQFALDGVNLEAMRYDDYIARPTETTEPQTP